jgi:hypothetical protein
MPVPFIDTVNTNVKPDLDKWFTVEWMPGQVQRLTFCKDFVDQGTFDLLFFGKLGTGYADLVQAAEDVAAALEQMTDAAGLLQLVNFGTPQDWAMNQKNFVVVMPVEYRQTLP